MVDSKGDSKFCKNCGAENDANVKFCKECGQSLQKNTNNGISKGIRSNKIVLGAIIVVLIVIAGIGANYAYGNYKTSQMDKYAKESNVYADQTEMYINGTEKCANNFDLPDALIDINQAQINLNQSINLTQQAYNYADGPYKDLFAVEIQKQQAYLDLLNMYLTGIQDYQSGDYTSFGDVEQQIKDQEIAISNYQTQYNLIKAQNPGMQEHIDKNW